MAVFKSPLVFGDILFLFIYEQTTSYLSDLLQ